MRSISDTIARLTPKPIPAGPDRLGDLDGAFDNPGALRARTYVPQGLAPGAALVVVLHGCTQTAAGYDQGSGWSDVADAHGFALLFPEQVRANNPNLCFNWFQPGDTTRGRGEVASICAMVTTMVDRHDLDPARVFITGLSAGGAMTAAMLATYPELFAGGAIIAGLPYGVADGVPQALERMRGAGLPQAAALAAAVRAASPHRGPWPRIAVWHGSADATVAPVTGEAVVAQWLGVHGLADAASVEDRVDGHPHSAWYGDDGQIAVESHVIAGMGHGTPLDTAGCGTSGPYMLDVGISSTLRIARSWGLVPDTDRAGRPTARARRADSAPAGTAPAASDGIGQVIEDALRSAGLVR